MPNIDYTQNEDDGPILDAAAHRFWEEHGYLVVPDAVPQSLCDAVIAELLEFLQLSPEQARHPPADARLNGRVGGVTQSQALWNTRQWPRLHKIFSELYGTERLWVTQDAWDMKPPFTSSSAIDPSGRDLRFEGGGIWFGAEDKRNRLGAMHFDLTRRCDFERMLNGELGGPGWRPTYPQAVLYLNDRTEHGGGLRLVPGFHKEARAWLDMIPVCDEADFEPKRFIDKHGELAAELNERAINIPAKAGSLVIWHRLTPHCNGRNMEVDSTPRFAQYITMGLTPTNPGEYTEAAARHIAAWKKESAVAEADQTDDQAYCRQWERRRPPAALTQLGRRLVGLEPWPVRSDSLPSAAMVSVQALSWEYVDGTGTPPVGAVEAVLDWTAAEHSVGRLDLEDRLLAEVDGGLAKMDRSVLHKLAEEFHRRGVLPGYIGLTVDLETALTAASIEAELVRCFALIDVAAELGFGIVRVPGNAVQPGLPEAAAWALIKSKFERAVAYARERGVTVGLHNHAGLGNAIPASAAGLLAMLEQVPGLQLILDVGNGNFTGCPELHSAGQCSPERLYREVAACVHKAAVVRLKFVDCGSGTEQFIDYSRIFEMLRGATSLRWVSVVYYDTVAGLPAADALPLCMAEVNRWCQHYALWK